MATHLSGRGQDIMNVVETAALEAAVQTLIRLLEAEAEEQNAYIFHFPDGRVSLELEWIDVASIIRSVIEVYVEQTNGHISLP
ncbi:MAG TPA: hypothetical protein VFI58_15730 [Xanthobacteraceae bacterium]|jgi:hypothetical protein|nr:hypothetical protein [Xanthobacteraceae bacterium]